VLGLAGGHERIREALRAGAVGDVLKLATTRLAIGDPSPLTASQP
jgi:hypothetical protein